MSIQKPRYVTVDEIIPKDFLKEPTVILAEYGNGMGKTHCLSDYAVKLQKTKVFDRIYILQYSQKGCENVVRKIERFGGWCVWHIGFEKFCPFFSNYKFLINLGVPLFYICSFCSNFKNKSRLAYVIFTEMLRNRTANVIKPSIVLRGLGKGREVCTHPIIRAFALDPTFDIEKRENINETPIVVLPSEIFLNHRIIGRWKSFSYRQRRERRVLLIVDEADTIFFSSLKVELEDVSPTQADYQLLQMFSPKTRSLHQLIDIYLDIYNIIKGIYSRALWTRPSEAKRIEPLLERAKPLLRSFERRRKDILAYVLKNKVKTVVFKIVNALEELTNVENLSTAVKTLEKTKTGFQLYDYDYGIRVLFDTSYPWRWFWKVNLSATFPTNKIIESRFISDRSKALLARVKRRTRTYENVYTTSISLFEKIGSYLNRNAQISRVYIRILKAVKDLVQLYKDRFGGEPKGVCLWFGNTTQLWNFVKQLRKAGIKIKCRKRYCIMGYKNIPIFISYAGSTIARGIDLDTYDISISIAPLLRPPRPDIGLDPIDFAKGINEAVQALMRVVRSPHPSRPKLVVVESTMTTSFYASFYPEWFRRLFVTNFLQ